MPHLYKAFINNEYNLKLLMVLSVLSAQKGEGITLSDIEP